MRRVFRLIFRLSAGLSSVICLGTVALWVVGHFEEVSVSAQFARSAFADFDRYHVSARPNQILYAHRSLSHAYFLRPAIRQMPSFNWFHSPAITFVGSDTGSEPGSWNFLGFGGESFRLVDDLGGYGRGMEWDYFIPYWAIVLVSAVLPVYAIARRRPRKRAGFCSQCGYDLRASAERCPECGTGFSLNDIKVVGGVSGKI
jgi:hypothetical protein